LPISTPLDLVGRSARGLAAARRPDGPPRPVNRGKARGLAAQSFAGRARERPQPRRTAAPCGPAFAGAVPTRLCKRLQNVRGASSVPRAVRRIAIYILAMRTPSAAPATVSGTQTVAA
jgi:hypothetical protein